MTARSPSRTINHIIEDRSASVRTARTGTQAIERAFLVLRAFTDTDPVWTLANLSRHLGLTKPTVLRLLGVLEREAMIQRTEPLGTYRLGPGAIQLGAMARRSVDFYATARPELQRLAWGVGETASLEVATWKPHRRALPTATPTRSRLGLCWRSWRAFTCTGSSGPRPLREPTRSRRGGTIWPEATATSSLKRRRKHRRRSSRSAAIDRERRLELAFEGDRFPDLVRTGRAVSVLGIEPFRQLWPVPYSEIVVAPGLTQNPGY